MRYSIFGFSQQDIIESYENITVSDLLILDYIYNAAASPTMEHYVDNEDIYVWLSHKKILEDLPILNISESRLKYRLSSLVNTGLLKTYHTCIPGMRGSKTFYCITEECANLKYGPSIENNTRSMDQVLKTGCDECEPSIENNTSNKTLHDMLVSKDTNNRDNKLDDICQKKVFDRFIDLYHEHCPDLPKVRAITDKRKKAIQHIVSKYGWTDVITVFNLAQASDFLKHGAEDGGWNGAGIDFILREDKFISILEGKYDNRTKKKQSADGLPVPKKVTKEEKENEYIYKF